jgi:hypothetical protein
VHCRSVRSELKTSPKFKLGKVRNPTVYAMAFVRAQNNRFALTLSRQTFLYPTGRLCLEVSRTFEVLRECKRLTPAASFLPAVPAENLVVENEGIGISFCVN